MLRHDQSNIIKSSNRFLKYFATYIAIAGTVSFCLFILEESFQTTMFGTWAAADAKDWQVVKIGVDLMKKQHKALKLTNNLIGWIQPLAWFSYDAYAESEDYYIKALKSKVLAHAPELFLGEEIEVTVKTKSYIKTSNGLEYKIGKIKIISQKELKQNERIKGILNNGLTIII